MRLTEFTDVALRLVMRLAAAGEDERLTTRAAADMLAVSYAHTAKAVARLSELGLVEARRGRGGGLRLTDAARRTPVGAVVRDLEGAGDVVGCTDDPPCPLRAACQLRRALWEAQEAFFASLDRFTVQDLAASPTREVLISLGTTTAVGDADPG